MRDVDVLIKKHLGENCDISSLDKELLKIKNEMNILERDISKNKSADLFSAYGKLSAKYESLNSAKFYINSLKDNEEINHSELKSNLEIKLQEFSQS